MRVSLIRHAETSWNKICRIQGQKQVGLSERGITQAKELCNQLKSSDFQLIYSSDLKRSLQTAEIINGYLRLPIRQMEGLREISYGNWEGKLWSEVYKANPHLNNSWKSLGIRFSSPGGESAVEFRSRVVRTFTYIVDNHHSGNILIVTHAQVINMILTYFQKVKDSEIFTFMNMDNCAVITIDEKDMKHFIGRNI